jgi:hypothetical protein
MQVQHRVVYNDNNSTQHEVLPEKLMVTHLVKKLINVLRGHCTATGTFLKPHESSPCPHTLFHYDPFSVVSSDILNSNEISAI